jgi:hypothetical protein
VWGGHSFPLSTDDPPPDAPPAHVVGAPLAHACAGAIGFGAPGTAAPLRDATARAAAGCATPCRTAGRGPRLRFARKPSSCFGLRLIGGPPYTGSARESGSALTGKLQDQTLIREAPSMDGESGDVSRCAAFTAPIRPEILATKHPFAGPKGLGTSQVTSFCSA